LKEFSNNLTNLLRLIYKVISLETTDLSDGTLQADHKVVNFRHPRQPETFKEGLGGVLLVAITPFVIFYFLNKIFPAFLRDEHH